MTIKFNEVTWYSKLAAIILFIFIVPALTFILGREYQKTADVLASLDNSQFQNAQMESTEADIDGSEDDQAFLQADYNFDGLSDKLVLLDCGATGNCSYEVHLYNPKTKDYLGVIDSSIKDEKVMFVMTNPSVNKKERLACSYSNVGAGNYYMIVYKYSEKDNNFVQMKEFSGSSENIHGCTLMTKAN